MEIIKNKYGKHIIQLEIHLINIPEFLRTCEDGMELRFIIRKGQNINEGTQFNLMAKLNF
jgi:hypothetical protein